MTEVRRSARSRKVNTTVYDEARKDLSEKAVQDISRRRSMAASETPRTMYVIQFYRSHR